MNVNRMREFLFTISLDSSHGRLHILLSLNMLCAVVVGGTLVVVGEFVVGVDLGVGGDMGGWGEIGGWGEMADKYHKRLAKLISLKRNEEYSKVMSHMRIKIRFALLRATLVALRGERGKQKRGESSLSLTSFNQIPSAKGYYCP